MFKYTVVLLGLMFAGVAQAVQFQCQASLSFVESEIWNGGYQISLRPSLNGSAIAYVRINRNYRFGDLPTVEVIQMPCVPGSDGAEFDCIEANRFNGRSEILAAQFFANAWSTLYATRWDIWQPYAFANVPCLRR